MFPRYTTSTDPHPPGTMTKAVLHNQHPNPNDGQFYPIYHDFSDFSNAGGSPSGERGGQPVPGFSTMSQTEGAFPHNWYYGMDDVDLFLPPSPPDIVRGEGGQGLPPQVPWECRTQAYPALMGGTVAMASSTSRYFAADDSMDGYYEQVGWPPPPMGQISPSPSQSSHYDSSPASGCGAQFPRHNNGCSSLPVSSAAAVAVEQLPFDARFRHVPEQSVSSVDGPMTPGGARASDGSHIFTESLSTADNQTTRPPRRTTKNQTITTTTTTDYNAGTLSPAATPSPTDGTAATAALYQQPASHNAHRTTREQQTPKRSSGNTKHAAAAQPARRPTAQEKQEHGQGQKSQPRTQRARNREAANKCRAKTKLAVADLESTERAMSAENRELSATARGLRDEVLRLKNALLSHANCDDDLIQRYLTNQARMVGGGAGVAHQHQHQQKIQHC